MTDHAKQPGPDAGIAPSDADPGAANTPRGEPGERPTVSAGDRTGQRPPPGTNQGKNEPVPASPEETADPAVASADPQQRSPESGDGPPAERQAGGSPTQAAQEGRPLAQGKTAGTNPASQAVVGRSAAPDGEVSPR